MTILMEEDLVMKQTTQGINRRIQKEVKKSDNSQIEHEIRREGTEDKQHNPWVRQIFNMESQN